MQPCWRKCITKGWALRVHDLAPLSDRSLCLVFEVEDEIAQTQLPVLATCCPPPQLPLWSLLETKANPSSSGSCLDCGVLAQLQKSSEYKGRHGE